MVKNLPTVERSTKIRFGKNATEDQGENTIVFNASNTQIDTTQSGSVYISPLRQVLDVSDRQIKILTYNRISKEITDSGVAAVDVLQPNFQATTNLGNTTTNTLEFNNTETGFVTVSNVGIANSSPLHTLDVGSNLYVHDTGSNVLVVNGNTNIKGDIVVQGNAQIDGVLTVINTENLTITDAIIELGRNNTVGDTTLDLGIVMNRPGSNVTVGFLEGSSELALAYTETSAESKTITPLTSETLDVHVYGRVLTESNIGIINTSPIHTLDVGSNLFVDEYGSNVLVVSGNTSISGDLTVDEDTFHVDVGGKSIGLGTVTPDANLHVIGNVYVSSNLTVDENTLHVDAMTNSVGIETKNPQANLHVVGNVYVSSNLTVDEDTLHVDATTHSVGVETKNPQANLHVVGNVYVSSNLTVDEDTFHVDTTTHSVGVETKNPSANLHVVGNVYVSSNLTIDEDTFHVDATTNSVGIETKNPQANLHVVGNTYISDDLTVATDTFHVDATIERVGIKTKTPDAELHVVGNVYVSSNLTVDEDTLHVDATTNSVGIETKNPQANLHVVGNVYVSSNLTVDEDTLHVDATTNSIGIETKFPKANLHVVGNVYVSSNLTVDDDTLHVDATTNSVGIETKNPKANLHVVGNVYVSSNLTVDEYTLHVDATTNSVGIETKNPKANLHVVGNVYVSSNLTVDEDTFHVDATTKSVGIETKNPTSNLHVVGNAYVSSNLTTDGTLTLNHPTTALITDLTSNVEVKLNQMTNVSINTPVADQLLVYSGEDWINEYPMHTYIRIRNDAGTDLSRGDVVYVTGAHNQNVVNVGLARADSPSTMPAIGVVNDATITQGGQGVAVAYGRAQSVNTLGFIEGETLYVSNTVAGGLSNVKPFYTDSVPDSIQNVGVVVKVGENNGTIFVTGIGRANDVPNAQIVLDEGDINWVYVSDQNNDFQKIEPSNLLTQLQTLQQVTDTGNTTSNTIQFTDVTTGLVTVANVEVGSNISVAGLIDAVNKHVPMVGTDGFLEKSPIYFTPGGTYVVSAAEAEFLGNLTLSGNTTILNSESVTISDRIFGVAANNSVSGLDSGFMIEHQEGDPLEYANVALIYHADEHRLSISYTQNTFTDDHILHYEDETHQMLIDLRGNVLIQNNVTIGETLDVTGTVTFADDLTVGAVSNLFVDVSTSRVGINEGTPLRNLDVNGDARIQDTTDTASTSGGALVVLGGLGVASNIHSTNVYAASHVGVGTVTTTRPVHVMATSTGGVYINGDGNDARVALEATGATADPVTSFTVNGGESFSVGIDNSVNDTFNISNHASDVGTNARLTMTPAGITTLTNATNATSKTTGSLILGGGLGVTGDIHATHANLEDVEADSVTVTDATAATGKTDGALVVTGGVGVSGALFGSTATFDGVTSVTNATAATSKTDGALVVTGGVGISGALFGSTATFDGVVTLTDATESTSSTTGALKAAGGVGIAKDVYVGERAYVAGGLVTNTGGVTKKTYSFSGDLGAAQTIADSTIKITFSAHVFYAKIVAHLVESDDEVSTLSMECGGGHWTGGTPLAIAKGPVSIFGSASTNPWSSAITTTTTEVSFKPTTDMAVAGHYNVFIEYISQSSSGTVTKITEGSTDVITFGY